MKLDTKGRESRMVRITRDVRREAYPPSRDPSEPLIIGNPRPRSSVLVMRADFVALAETLEEYAALKAEVERLRVGNERLHHDATNAMAEADDWKTRAEKAEALLVPCGKCGTRRVTCDCYGGEALLAKCVEALEEAARSLESASRFDRVESCDVRNYCLSRATVARAALAAVKEKKP